MLVKQLFYTCLRMTAWHSMFQHFIQVCIMFYLFTLFVINNLFAFDLDMLLFAWTLSFMFILSIGGVVNGRNEVYNFWFRRSQARYDYKPYTLYSELCRKLKVAIMFDMNILWLRKLIVDVHLFESLLWYSVYFLLAQKWQYLFIKDSEFNIKGIPNTVRYTRTSLMIP